MNMSQHDERENHNAADLRSLTDDSAVQTEVDYRNFELSSATPMLRRSLQFKMEQAGDSRWILVEDPIEGRFFRVGLPEYQLMKTLDGATRIQDATAIAARSAGVAALNEDEAAELCNWLIQTGLATKTRADGDQADEVRQRERDRRRMQWLNPLMLQMSLGNPDSIVQLVSRPLRFLVHPISIACWFAVVLWGVMNVCVNWQFIVEPASECVSMDNAAAMLLVWLGLRVVHESAHAIAAACCGVPVRRWGILLLLFIPMPFVDVTAAWRMDRRRDRMLVGAAGMMTELFIAAIAGFVVCNTQSVFIRQI
ncbi:MAG: site-2 protease family protein, partial [Planctomycetota bacterium]